MRSRTSKLIRLLAPVGLIPLFACLAPPVESPKTTITQETSVRVEQNIKNKVDLLFMVDNSPSMAPKQTELRNRFPQLITALQNFATMGSPASYHIGVVTSDLGAGQFNLNNGQCHPGGDGAKLQVAPAPSAINPPANCANFGLSGGQRFLDYNQLTGTNNITGGLDVPSAFNCMASVGEAGCGFEYQLESVYRALHDPIPENQGFLRPDAILAVVWVTDEDDCAAPDDTDLFDPSTAGINKYSTLHSFRCTQFGIMCNNQLVPGMSTGGAIPGSCVSAPASMGGKLTDINKYINFFSGPAASGGVKTDPNDVILVSIVAPPQPVAVDIKMPCPDQPNTPSCSILTHSCVAAANPKFFGDPAVRINQVVTSAKNHNETSICDTDYTAAIDALGNLIISQIGAGCLNSPVAKRADGTPDCVVEDVTANTDGTSTTKEIPSCAQGASPPCWKLDDKLAQYQQQGCVPRGQVAPMSCKLPPSCQPVTNPVDNTMQLASIGIDRGGAMPPANTTAHVSCATIASSSK